MQNVIGRTTLGAMLLAGLLVCCSCTSDNGKGSGSIYDRQERAIKDPFGYSPAVGKPDDISSGDIGSFDHKGMQRDVDHVLNP